MPEDIDHHRRRFFGTALAALAAVQFAGTGPAAAQSDTAGTAKPGSQAAFGPLKQIDAGS
ncbi:hypothetical protein KXS07_12425 [Inquilinus limosus]|uniref:hypothetical protein n=1 Tax=Inquilinus limosus TaxID=171674 RepID=UPI003F154F44